MDLDIGSIDALAKRGGNNFLNPKNWMTTDAYKQSYRKGGFKIGNTMFFAKEAGKGDYFGYKTTEVPLQPKKPLLFGDLEPDSKARLPREYDAFMESNKEPVPDFTGESSSSQLAHNAQAASSSKRPSNN